MVVFLILSHKVPPVGGGGGGGLAPSCRRDHKGLPYIYILTIPVGEGLVPIQIVGTAVLRANLIWGFCDEG